jgi:hypothetical protein
MREMRRQVAAGRRAVAHGQRPVYHLITSFDGAAVDVRVRELPLVHLFVPDDLGALDGVKALISRTLGVDPGSFGVEPEG